MSGPARDAVRGLDANLPIFDVDIVQSALDQAAWPLRVFGSLFLAFGLAALFLAAVGLYGVMAFSVRRRTREIGIRMALGASSRSVLGSVLAQALADRTRHRAGRRPWCDPWLGDEHAALPRPSP